MMTTAPQRILAAIKDRAMTSTELESVVHLDRRNVNVHIKRLRELGLVYIHAYGSYNRILYKAGNKPDAAKPPAKKHALIVSEHRKRNKENINRNRRNARAFLKVMKKPPTLARIITG